jgi:prolyl-tRNA synthetase
LICEVGPKDLEKRSVAITWRDQLAAGKAFVAFDELAKGVAAQLQQYEQRLFDAAAGIRAARLRADIATLADFKAYFSESGDKGFTSGTGFVQAPFCGDEDAVEGVLKELGVTIRCMPLDNKAASGTCILTGRPATCTAIFARAY